MPVTRTGSFPIGFRRRRGAWEGDLGGLAQFVRAHDFAFVDFGPIGRADADAVLSAGARIGTVDLLRWGDLASPDAGRRRDAAGANAAHVADLTALGVRTFLAVVAPEDPARPRRENFAYAVDGYAQICQAIAPGGSRIALEGHPGREPHYASLACTPADCRAFLAAVGSDVLGLNFDPANLLRVGIAPLRFLRAFGPRVFHVHAKDVNLLDDGLYEHGNLQAPTFATPPAYAGPHWRYAIPGHGVAPWGELLTALGAADYRGGVSIELEDATFLGSAERERQGLLAGRDFLAGV